MFNKTTEKKESIFTAKMLPFYTQEELEKKLSPAEKKIAERSEYSGIDEATENYHKNNP